MRKKGITIRQKTGALFCVLLSTVLFTMGTGYGSPALAEQPDYQSIIAIRQNTSDRWTQEYANCRNETVEVNVSIHVPDVEQCPIIEVNNYKALPDDMCDSYVYHKEEYVTIFQGPNYPEDIPGGSEAAVTIQAFSPEEILSGSEASKDKQAEGSTLSPNGVDPLMRSILERYAPYYDCISLVPRCQMTYTRYYAFLSNKENEIIGLDQSNPVTDMGHYQTSYWETFHGIPWLVCDYYEKANGNPINATTWDITGSWFNEDSWFFHMQVLNEINVIVEDVPLVPFSVVRQKYEQWIDDGKIRSVYDVRLGYMLFSNENNADSPFYLIPVWVLYGDIYENSTIETSRYVDEYGNQADPFGLATSDRCVVVNAQTGEIMDRFHNTKTDRQTFKGFLSWEDVAE
ncbi:MAG: hypothetical protein PHO41_07695 [Eubacteriales bacterium]|nr:hypothetical protein [Eubacteriales bacterium]